MSLNDKEYTISVPAAGRRYFGLGRNASYEAAKRGDIPTIRIGKRLRAIVSCIEERLAQAGKATKHDPE